MAWQGEAMKNLALLAFPLLAAQAAPPAKPVVPAPSEIVAAAPKGDWVAIPASDLVVMDLASGKRVVIQLMPPPFSQGWVGNIRKLAAAHWWDGTSINRVQDNYVVQWGDANAEDKAKAKKLPPGLATVPQADYVTAVARFGSFHDLEKHLSREYEDYMQRDPFAEAALHLRGWQTAIRFQEIWPVHCYGMVGVGRGMPPDTGTGAELYTVIGHAPRHLDRNIALVGRVISGIEHLSSLPRGTGPLGFYEKPEERVTIISVRLASELPTDKPFPRYEYLSTESKSFAAYADARANRRDPFFIRPAGGADICNIPVPVRVVK
jgi:cyclophilin family peptidyl-prolyl cis-trans isomerase